MARKVYTRGEFMRAAPIQADSVIAWALYPRGSKITNMWLKCAMVGQEETDPQRFSTYQMRGFKFNFSREDFTEYFNVAATNQNPDTWWDQNAEKAQALSFGPENMLQAESEATDTDEFADNQEVDVATLFGSRTYETIFERRQMLGVATGNGVISSTGKQRYVDSFTTQVKKDLSVPRGDVAMLVGFVVANSIDPVPTPSVTTVVPNLVNDDPNFQDWFTMFTNPDAWYDHTSAEGETNVDIARILKPQYLTATLTGPTALNFHFQITTEVVGLHGNGKESKTNIRPD